MDDIKILLLGSILGFLTMGWLGFGLAVVAWSIWVYLDLRKL